MPKKVVYINILFIVCSLLPSVPDLFSMNPSMYERHTFWGVVIGGFTYWTSFNAVNQTMVQRYMSLPSLKKARQYVFL